jgi:hypothetical protein
MAGTTRRKPGWMGPYIEGLRACGPGCWSVALTASTPPTRWVPNVAPIRVCSRAKAVGHRAS